MRHATTGQPLLFRECHSDSKASPPNNDLNPETRAPAFSPEGGTRPQFGQPSPSRTVSPLANMLLTETCGFCGREVRPPGCVIPDYEELGAFCDQDCADRRFRMHLEDAPEEDSCSA